MSDHLPLEITINVDICDFLKVTSPISQFIPWSTLNDDEILNYRTLMTEALRNISIPTHALNHCHQLCDSNK